MDEEPEGDLFDDGVFAVRRQANGLGVEVGELRVVWFGIGGVGEDVATYIYYAGEGRDGPAFAEAAARQGGGQGDDPVLADGVMV
jgi:hypothetical protein